MKRSHVVVLTLWAIVCALNAIYWGWVFGYAFGGGS